MKNEFFHNIHFPLVCIKFEQARSAFTTITNDQVYSRLVSVQYFAVDFYFTLSVRLHAQLKSIYINSPIWPKMRFNWIIVVVPIYMTRKGLIYFAFYFHPCIFVLGS